MTDAWRNGNGLPGGGPWLILAECRAPRHNTARAAARDECICPHAKEALRAYRDRVNAERRVDPNRLRPNVGRRRAPRENSESGYITNIRMDVRAPDLIGALCLDPGGIHIVDRGKTQEIKAMCNLCPARVPCGTWAMEAEKPAGAWPGIYGGMTQKERRMKKAGVLV